MNPDSQINSWSAKQIPVSSAPSVSNDHQLPSLNSASSCHPSSAYASGTLTASQMTQQPVFSPYPVQQRQASCKSFQSQHKPTIRHASQVSQQHIQEQIRQHQYRPTQQPYPSSTYSTTATIQNATLPTCNIPHNTSRVYNTMLSSQKIMYLQSSVSSSNSSSAFSPLPQPRQEQLMPQQSTYNYQQQQFLLEQQQKQLYEQQQNKVNSRDHQMYSNWR